MKINLKPYEKLRDYTVRGKEFKKGFEELIIDLSRNADISYTIYIDTENNDIDSMPSCYYSGNRDTYYGINQAILEWQVSGRTRACDAFDYSELEDCVTEDEVKELRRKFEKEEDYSEDWYEDKRDFYRDYATEYTDFLLGAENKKIDECVDNYSRETSDFYLEQFEDSYYELLKDLEDQYLYEKEGQEYQDVKVYSSKMLKEKQSTMNLLKECKEKVKGNDSINKEQDIIPGKNQAEL